MSTTRTEARAHFIEATRRTFSEMAFLDVAAISEPQNQPVLSQVIQLAFLEPDQGFAALFLPLDCKRHVVENIYGEDWEDLQPDQIDDCLLELLNVLVGNYLLEVYGHEAARDIALPRLLFDESEITITEDQETFYFDAEGTVFKAVLESKHLDKA